MKLIHAARTDVGMIRSGNEDNFTVDSTAARGIFIVADGMGGHAAGEVASEMAVQIVQRELSNVRDLDGEDVVQLVANALKHANRAIHERTLTEVDKQGMGTTASVLVLAGSRYLIGQVGDSRVYLLRAGKFDQLTKDHSYVQEQVDAGYLTPEQARYHPYSNVITRCVGAGSDVEPDIYRGEVRAGRRLPRRERRPHRHGRRPPAARSCSAHPRSPSARCRRSSPKRTVAEGWTTSRRSSCRSSRPIRVADDPNADGGDGAGWLTRPSARSPSCTSGNILYAIELAALSLDGAGQGRRGGVLPRDRRASSPRRTGARKEPGVGESEVREVR